MSPVDWPRRVIQRQNLLAGLLACTEVHALLPVRWSEYFILKQVANFCPYLAFSKDGRYIATGSQDSTVKVIDVSRIHAAYLDKADEKPVIRALYDHTAQVNDLKFHPNGKLLASASDDCNIKFYDLTKSNIKRGFRVLYVSFSDCKRPKCLCR